MSEIDFSNEAKEFLRTKHPQKLSVGDKLVSLLKSKAEEHNNLSDVKVSFEILKKVYWRGSQSHALHYSSDTTKSQWSICRVNSFLKLLRGSKDLNESYYFVDLDIAHQCDNFPKISECSKEPLNFVDFFDFNETEFALAHVDLVKFNIPKWEQNDSDEDLYLSIKDRETLNTPFSLGSNSEFKFGVIIRHGFDGVKLIKFGCESSEASEVKSNLLKSDPQYWVDKFFVKSPIDESVSSDALDWDEDNVLGVWGWDTSSFKTSEEIIKQEPTFEEVING